MEFVEELSVIQDPTDFNEILKTQRPCLNSEFLVSANKFAERQKPSPENVHLFVLGPTMHGKKRLLEYFANCNLEIPVHKNIHFAYGINGFMLQGVDVQLNMWHVGNIERSLDILKYWYKMHRTCFMLVYDVNDSTTFDDIHQWIPSLRCVLDEHVPIVLVGYEDIKEVETSKLLPISYSDGMKTKTFFGLASFYEFSDLTGPGVSELFFEAAHIALESERTTQGSKLPELDETIDSDNS